MSTGWHTLEDPHGFRVQLPDGWHVRVVGSGCVVMTPQPETLTGPQAFVWVVHRAGTTSASDVAVQLVAAYRAALPDMTAQGPTALAGACADSCSIRGGFTLQGRPWQYLFVTSAAGAVATVSGFSAPAELFAGYKPAFTYLLSTFQFDPALRDSNRIAPPATEWTDWRDPNEGGFTARLPTGWGARGGTVRPYLDAWRWFEAFEGGEQVALRFYQPAMPLFTEPNPMMAFTGFGEGSRYNPSGGVSQDMIVQSYPGAGGYLERWLLPQMRQQYADLAVEAVAPRPDLAAGEPGNPWMNVTRDAVGAALRYAVGGVPVMARLHVVTLRLQLQGMGGMWFANLHGFHAPADCFERTRDVFWRVIDSFQIDPAWAANEARQQQIRSGIISDAHHATMDSLRESYERRSRSMDEISRRWSNAILGQCDLVDPSTGEVIHWVPNGASHYWRVGSTVVGTDVHSRPAIDAVELQNLDDLMRS